MSIKAMTYIWENSSASGTALLCLLALADHASDEGEAFPGMARLSKRCRFKDKDMRCIRRLLDKLEADGEIIRENGTGIHTKNGTTNRYYLVKYRESIGIKPPQNRGLHNPPSEEQGVTQPPPQGVTQPPPQGVTQPTDPSVKPSVKPSVLKAAEESIDISNTKTAAAQVNKFGTRIDGHGIVDSDPGESGPKHPPVQYGVVTNRNFDPRKIVGGLIPEGQGATPVEVHLEFFKKIPTEPQMREMRAQIDDLPKWRGVCKRVSMRNGDPYGMDKMLHIYANGFREDTQKGHRNDRSKPVPAIPAARQQPVNDPYAAIRAKHARNLQQ